MTDSIRFPFTQLPPNSLTKILEFLDVFDLFDLSFCSKKFYQIVRDFASSKPPLQIIINTNIRPTVIVQEFQWNVRDARSSIALDLKNVHYRMIGGVNMKFGVDKFGKRALIEKFHDIDVLRLANYLMRLFKCNIERLELGVPESEDLLVIQSWQFLHKSNDFEVGYGVVTHKEMSGFLDKFMSNYATFRCYAGPDFVYENCISFFHLHIFYSAWFTRQNLLNMNSAQVILERSNLTSTDINAFLHRWLDSRDCHLQYVEISGNPYSGQSQNWNDLQEGYKTLNRDQIVMGLDTIPGSRKNREACSYQRFQGISFESGLDIQRADGLLGTICLHQRSNDPLNLAFVFVVWQHPNPFAP